MWSWSVRRALEFRQKLSVLLRKCLTTSKTSLKTEDVNLLINRIRNVGVLAHIDAGKTTTTERMLYYAGFLSRMGNVDDGSTTMDYLQQEKERGITINAAAITFPWKEFQLNLIDTPGHIDFTFEVERSLRVLDGAVVVLDGSAGVESQTSSVWVQADRYHIPRIVFINKMDHSKSNSIAAVDSLKMKLKANPVILQLPIETNKRFSGVVDLVSMQMLSWGPDTTDGSKYQSYSLDCNQKGSTEEVKALFIKDNLKLNLNVDYLSSVYKYRSQLIEQLAMYNNELLDIVLTDNYNPLRLNQNLLMSCIKDVTINCTGVPVLYGSALKNKGIQPLLDSIIHYLPSPQETSMTIPDTLKNLFAFAFKVTHDLQRGPLVYIRIYSGTIKSHSTIYNMTQRKREKISRVLLMLADEQREMQQMCEGNIAVVVGMKHTVTGDTLVQSISVADQLVNECSNKQLQLLQSPKIPEPMFFCTIEPPSAAIQSALDNALACLSREDPSLIVTSDTETGQTILSGMGDLHLDIILNRIKSEYKVDASLGRLQVAYRESPTKTATINENFSFNSGNRTYSIDVSLRIVPSDQSQPKVIFPTDISALSTSLCKDDLFSAVADGFKTATLRGPLLSFPLSQLNLVVDSLIVSPGTPLIKVTNIFATCVSKALSQADVILLEPFVQLEVLVSEVHLQVVLGDLVRTRRGVIKTVDDQQDLKRVLVVFPVASLSGYSKALRTMTSGMASFGSQFSHYEAVSDQRMKAIHEEITGFST